LIDDTMKKTTGIYLPDGTVHRFAEAPSQGLDQHIATRDRSPDFTALGLYLPNPDPILKKLGKDVSTYRDLRSLAPVGGAIRRRKAAVRAMEWRVVDEPTAGGASLGGRQKASARAMQLAQAALGGLDIDALLGDLLDAPLFGWVPVEVMWASQKGALLPVQLSAKPPEWFVFDSDGGMRFRSREQPLYGEALQPRKFLVPRQDASYANPYGFADLSMCFWPATFMRGGLRFWVTFAEKYGSPWIVGKQPRSAGAKQTNDLLDQLEAMVQDAVAVVPDDSSVEIKESGGKSDAAGAYKELLMYCRSEVSIALLGSNQSTEASSTLASATVGLEVAKDLRDGDARLVEAAINQLLRWVTDLNLGESAPSPRFEIFEQKEVSEQQAKRDESMSRSGVKFSSEYWQRAYNLRPGDIADVVQPGAVAPASPVAGGLSYAEGTPGDAMDALVDAELTDSWQQAMAPLVDPAQALIDEAKRNGWTAQQLIDRLPDVLAQMDPGKLADSLTRATTTARLAGAAGIPPAQE
jgi:phage gp29-like protein